ncbi:MAG: IS1595 family transposase, partial [Proteobacteria bacterium]|nr:IS1595 family transposase [Pseudomonadota bacterium]
MWYITNQKQGVTALGLQRVLGLGSYQTAWTMLHRLRRAMIRPGRDRLHGIVEVDETFIGRSTANSSRNKKKLKKSSSQALRHQSVVAIAIEIKPKMGFGRVRMRRLTDKSARSLTPFVLDSVSLRSLLRTDGSAAYRFLSRHGYRRDQYVMLGAEQPA